MIDCATDDRFSLAQKSLQLIN